MIGFLLHHWKFGLGGIGLLLVIALLFVPGAIGLIRDVLGFVVDKLRALVKKLRGFTREQWWATGCLTAAALCVYFAIQTGNARHERDTAVQQLASVQTTIKAFPDQLKQARKDAAATAKAECARDNAEAVAQAEARVRVLEAQLAQALQGAALNYEKGKADAKRKGDAAAADVRSGALQLRDEWGGPFNVPGLAAGPGQPDDAADLRAAGAGSLVQVGATCDAQVAGLQSVLVAERQALK